MFFVFVCLFVCLFVLFYFFFGGGGGRGGRRYLLHEQYTQENKYNLKGQVPDKFEFVGQVAGTKFQFPRLVVFFFFNEKWVVLTKGHGLRV